jgi:hypothetical protein
MDITPIASWKEYVRAVKQMREYQKLYFTLKSQMALGLAKAWEAAVDEATGRKLAGWAGEESLEEKNNLPFEEEK